MPTDGGNFLLSPEERVAAIEAGSLPARFVRPYVGGSELLSGRMRFCIWIEDVDLPEAMSIPFISERVEKVKQSRSQSSAPTTRATKVPPHKFMQIEGTAQLYTIAVGAITSENREYLPVALLDSSSILSNKCYALYDASLWNLAIVGSRLHRVWIETVCARMRSDYSYSNTLGWNTFPVPKLTDKNKADLTRCAENILLAREEHFPATIAELYDPSQMPAELREAHERNDETLERIYIGRRFKNDTERLEKLFDLYTTMTEGQTTSKKRQTGTNA